MIHYRNRRSFASRTARGFARLQKFSSADKPAPSDLAFAGTTGSAEGSDSKIGDGLSDTRGSDESIKGNSGSGVVPTAPPCGVTTATAFIPVLAVGQYHYDRWATLAVIAVFLCGFAIAAIRANRSSRPHTPPRTGSPGDGIRWPRR